VALGKIFCAACCSQPSHGSQPSRGAFVGGGPGQSEDRLAMREIRGVSAYIPSLTPTPKTKAGAQKK